MLKQIFLLFALFQVTAAAAQLPTNFKVMPEKPSASEELTITYNSSGTVLKGKSKVNAVVYNFINYKWIAQDLKMTGTNNQFQGKYTAPTGTGIIALKFVSDTLTDNANNEGYFVFLKDKQKGIEAQGAYAGWGLARSANYGRTIPNYINKSISDSATYHWLSQEISYHQSTKNQLAYLYTEAAYKAFKDDAKPRIEKVLTYLQRADATEQDLLNARKIYSNITKDQTRADSLTKVIEQRFPKGSLSRLAAYRKLNTATNQDERLLAIQKFLTDYPELKENNEFDSDYYINYNSLYQNAVMINFIKSKDYSVIDQYKEQLSFDGMISLYYKLVDISYKREDVPFDKLLTVSENFFKEFEKYRAKRPEKYNYLSPSEWQDYYFKLQAPRNFGIHASLLNKAKRYAEAAKYVKPAVLNSQYKNAFLNDVYATTLSHLGDTKGLKTLLEKSYHENQVTTNMADLMAKLYVKEKGSEKGLEAYLNGFKNREEEAKDLAKIKDEMMNKPLPDFAMQDLNGKTVKLSELKGKTVVLDFWATWCVPCKASFPGMKLAVERFKNDPNVVFFFVDTEERGTTFKAEVAKYIKDNKYPFQVLFDNPLPSGKSTGEVYNRISKAFGISGIPQKIFVDGNGNVRFISVGFSGSATQLADEISTMVELTKNAK